MDGFVMIYSGNSPPGIQAVTNWKGSTVTPMRGATFGCTKCFQITASRRKACTHHQRERINVTIPGTNMLGLLRIYSGVILQPFDANLQVAKVSFVRIEWTPRSNRPSSNVRRTCKQV